MDECETPTFFIGLEVEGVGVSHVYFDGTPVLIRVIQSRSFFSHNPKYIDDEKDNTHSHGGFNR